jgi:hypothetical protein
MHGATSPHRGRSRGVHVNPYGLLELNMDERIEVDLKMAS